MHAIPHLVSDLENTLSSSHVPNHVSSLCLSLVWHFSCWTDSMDHSLMAFHAAHFSHTRALNSILLLPYLAITVYVTVVLVMGLCMPTY